jgi:hypothetical protein
MSRARAGPSRKSAVAAAVLAAALSASCVESTPAGPTLPLVPQGAIAALVVESPYKLYGAAEAFWKAAGLDKASGMDLKGFLGKSVPATPESLEALDFARPWALVILPAPAGAEGKRTRTCLYLPYRSSPDALLEKLAGGSLVSVAKAKGYVVLSDSEGELRFPAAKGANLSRLARYPASSVKLWADPAALRLATGGGFKPIAEAARSFVSDPEGGDRADAAALSRALGDFGLSILSQLELADASIELGPTGLVLRAGASSARGSDLGKLIAAQARAPSALDWASQVDSKALFGASWSMDGAAGSGLYGRLAEGLFAALGLSPDIAAKASAFQATWSAAQGPRGAMSLDLDLDAAALSPARSSEGDEAQSDQGEAASELLSKALRVRFELVREARDQAACRALLKGLPSDPDFLALSKAYGEEIGFACSLSGRELKDGAFSYGELGFELSLVEGGKLGSLGGAGGAGEAVASAAALAALGPQLRTRWAVSQGRLVATNGDVAALKALAARKAVKESLAADPAFAAFAKTMPPKPAFVGAFSMRRLMALAAAGEGGANGAAVLPFDPETLGSWYSYMAVDSRGGQAGLEAGFFIPASDLRALFGAASGSFKRMNVPNGGV